MPRLSILIPCLGGAAEFDGTLVSVLQHRPADCEVLVLHTEEYADPYDLGSEVQFVHVCRAGSLVDLINEGVRMAKSSLVHVLTCGLEAREGWTPPALRHFADDEIAAVAPVISAADGSRLISAGMRFTVGGNRRVLRDERLLAGGSGHLRAAIGGPTLAAGFFRRDVLAALGGFDASAGDGLADVDFALAIQALELRSALEPASRLIQASNSAASARLGQFASGRAAERLFWRQAHEAGLPLAMLAHLLVAATDVVRPLALLGRVMALAELGAAARYRHRIALAKERLAELRISEQSSVPISAARPKAAAARRPERKAA